MAAFVDLSHTVEDGMATYPGLPGPSISPYLTHEQSRDRYAAGTEFTIGRIEMVSNTGTYLDAPYHRFAGGVDVAGLPLPAVADLDGVVVRIAPDVRAIDTEAFDGVDVRDRAVLLHTGWDRHWGSPAYFEGHPFLTAGAARRLADGRAALVGIDSLNIDDTADGARPAHTTLLGSDIPVVEHLCGLEGLPDEGVRFFAVPVKVQGFGTFPVRAFGLVDERQ